EPAALLVLLAALLIDPAVLLGQPATVLLLAALPGVEVAADLLVALAPRIPLALARARAGLGLAAALLVEPARRAWIDPLATDLDPVALHPLAVGAEHPGVIAVVVAIAPHDERRRQVRADVTADHVAPGLGREQVGRRHDPPVLLGEVRVVGVARG